MGEENQVNAVVNDSRPFWKKKRWWVLTFVLILPYLAVGSVKLYRNYQFEQAKPEIVAALKKLVVTDFSNRTDGKWPEGVGVPAYLSYVKCENKVFLNPYQEWSTFKEQDEKVFLGRKLIELGGVDELAQWFACQGIKTRTIEPETILQVSYSRVFKGRFIRKQLWRSSLPIPYDWLVNSDIITIRFSNGQIASIEFESNSL